MKNLFPFIMAALSVAAAIVYALNKDWVRVIYWTAATAITLSVIYMK
jgi:hypothetical protein